MKDKKYKIDEILLTDEELEPIYNKCVEDNHTNGFAHAVAEAQLAKVKDNQLERLDGMKEEVARILCNKANPMMWDGEEHSFWDEKASESYKIGYYFIADEILASIRKVLE